MKAMHEQCIYMCGPYRGYGGRAEYDDEAGIFHGEVVGTRDVVTFQGKTLRELRQAFTDSVDEYVQFCKESGTEPDKPVSGKFVARISPELHRKVSLMAQAAGKSLNQFVCDCLESVATSDVAPAHGPSRLPVRESPRRSIRSVGQAANLRRGPAGSRRRAARS